MIPEQPWKSVWPAPAGAQDQAQTIADDISREEMTNQRSFGSHASNTKGRVVHLKKYDKTRVTYLIL
ncbi:hypothetical protein OQA88_9403 [Cercophora sp. LCS_1]